jgi:hypothetical protein
MRIISKRWQKSKQNERRWALSSLGLLSASVGEGVDNGDDNINPQDMNAKLYFYSF